MKLIFRGQVQDSEERATIITADHDHWWAHSFVTCEPNLFQNFKF